MSTRRPADSPSPQPRRNPVDDDATLSLAGLFDGAPAVGHRHESAAEPTPADFDALYRDAAERLVRQVYLLTGHQRSAARAVRRAFQLAWTEWAEVGRDVSPEGWVRAEACELALASVHASGPRRRPARRGGGSRPLEVPDASPSTLGLRDRAFVRALLRLPRPQRRALLLHDVIGLDWRQTAREADASLPAVRSRVLHARVTLTQAVPGILGADPMAPDLPGRIAEQARATAERACPDDPRLLPGPARARTGARLRDGGVAVTAGTLAVAAVGALLGAAALGDPFHTDRGDVRSHPTAPATRPAPTSSDALDVSPLQRPPTTPAPAAPGLLPGPAQLPSLTGALAGHPAARLPLPDPDAADPDTPAAPTHQPRPRHHRHSRRADAPSTRRRTMSQAAARWPLWSFCGLFSLPCHH